jgi:hypothetical protein
VFSKLPPEEAALTIKVSWAAIATAVETKRIVIKRTILKQMKSLGISYQIINENLSTECAYSATPYFMLSVQYQKIIQIILRF